jgi:hypothetical protein
MAAAREGGVGGGPCWAVDPPPQNLNLKNKFYWHDDIKRFMWFTPQPKSATTAGW